MAGSSFAAVAFSTIDGQREYAWAAALLDDGTRSSLPITQSSRRILATTETIQGIARLRHLERRFSLLDEASSGLADSTRAAPDAYGNLIGGRRMTRRYSLLGPLADNGGPTLTHALSPSSPAIDAGDPARWRASVACRCMISVGSRSLRVFGGRIDMGAVEALPAGFLAGDYNGNGVVEAGDYSVWRNTLDSATDLRADGNGDGIVDRLDYAVWKSNFGASLSEDRETRRQGDKERDSITAVPVEQVRNRTSSAQRRHAAAIATRQDRLLEAWVAKSAERETTEVEEPMAAGQRAVATSEAVDCAVAEVGNLRLMVVAQFHQHILVDRHASFGGP